VTGNFVVWHKLERMQNMRAKYHVLNLFSDYEKKFRTRQGGSAKMF